MTAGVLLWVAACVLAYFLQLGLYAVALQLDPNTLGFRRLHAVALFALPVVTGLAFAVWASLCMEARFGGASAAALVVALFGAGVMLVPYAYWSSMLNSCAVDVSFPIPGSGACQN